MTMAASGAGIAYFGLMAVAGIWPPMKEWSPAGLLAAADGTAEPGAIIVTIAVAAAAIVVGMAAFDRREL
ncbi:hypothetical protein CJ204_02090 [Corynebacterium xerosis]|uniref:Uncharacterized protein n=1 Tax=Corynebacterium xerosis TaxID=1725 RepID=A0A2N6T155_9CORY|nr:hypothetical protein CJ204_02090 [Corynebacterium xerosis]